MISYFIKCKKHLYLHLRKTYDHKGTRDTRISFNMTHDYIFIRVLYLFDIQWHVYCMNVNIKIKQS